MMPTGRHTGRHAGGDSGGHENPWDLLEVAVVSKEGRRSSPDIFFLLLHGLETCPSKAEMALNQIA